MSVTFRPLNANEIDVKVKQVKDHGLIALLYKTARTDMDILDESVGPENWDCDYKEIKGNLYCGIGINIDGKYVIKWDCGIESREDDEGNEKKGEASDAFKRAGFKWGIGRELYTSPFIWISADKCEIYKNAKGKPACNDKFTVSEIRYSDDNKRITYLSIANMSDGGAIVFTWGHKNPPRNTKQDKEKMTALQTCIETTAKKIGEKPTALFNMLKAKFGTDGQLPTDAIDNCINYLVQLQTAHANRVKNDEQVADGTNG